MAWKQIGIFALGSVAAAAASGVAKTEAFHNALVKATACVLKAGDKVNGFTQTVIDEAGDINAEAKRQAKIDAAVAERLAALEADVRAEVSAKVDAELAAEAASAK